MKRQLKELRDTLAHLKVRAEARNPVARWFEVFQRTAAGWLPVWLAGEPAIGGVSGGARDAGAAGPPGHRRGAVPERPDRGDAQRPGRIAEFLPIDLPYPRSRTGRRFAAGRVPLPEMLELTGTAGK